ncbi:hypothetical protein ACIO93_00215 [Streptomyces sp. NPDC087903]|uniref:hypothetical protein n=1 Tax=Streptomyces sp. NPDC087903 TaxID=3365819 RepID=UPI0037F3D489
MAGAASIRAGPCPSPGVADPRAEADGSPRGLWHLAVLATAKDRDTTLDTKAADFSVA